MMEFTPRAYSAGAIALVYASLALSQPVAAFIPPRPCTTSGAGCDLSHQGMQYPPNQRLAPCGKLPWSSAAHSSARRSSPLRRFSGGRGSRPRPVSRSAVSPTSEKERGSKRARVLHKLGIRRRSKSKKTISFKKEEDGTLDPESSGDQPVEVRTIDELNEYFSDVKRRFRKKSNGAKTSKENVDDDDEDEDEDDDGIDYTKLLSTLKVVGDTQIIGSPEYKDKVHPVLRLLHERRRTNLDAGRKLQDGGKIDGKKVALVVEGGGMRGCVSAGMVAAIYYLGLEDAFDVVYGASAGTIIGAYFITRQLPWFGPEIYYDSLTTAGKEFIDTKRLLRAVGLGLLDPRLLKDVVHRPLGKPVLNLSFLLKTTLQERKPLDWEKFCEMQTVQPLRLVASGLHCERSVVMDMENGDFTSLEELANCMHASCLLPGIAGPLMNLKKRENREGSAGPRLVLGNDMNDENWEPLADALIYEPMPYRSAIADGATHVVMLRTRPDGVDVTGKSSVFERRIMRRFFLRKNDLRDIYKYMRMQQHKRLYAEDVITLNEAANDFRDYMDTSAPHIMPIALPPGSDEVTRLETGREAIFEGVRRGFARAYGALVEDPTERGKGEVVARQYFPDAILDYEPSEFENALDSAFGAFLKKREEDGEGYDFPATLGKSAIEAGQPL